MVSALLAASVSSATLIQALRARHSDAVFVPECKMGASGSRRLDAWVLLRTWSPPTIIGYEVKATRADFVRDEKWRAYLDVCHLFYWVSPKGVVDPREVSDGCGLLQLHGSRLVTKVKATRHEPDTGKLANLMSYVLMSRTVVVRNMWEANRGELAVDMWRRLVEDRNAERAVGHAASRVVAEGLADARNRAADAERRSGQFERLEARLREIGVDPSEPWAIDRATARLRAQEMDARRSILQAARGLAYSVGARIVEEGEC